MLVLHDFLDSGNGYKVRLVLAHLGIPYRLVEQDILTGQTRTAGFLKKNPNGRIPTLELEDGTCLAESNAITYWLARDTRLWPQDKLEQAQTLQWMFFEQYSHEPYIAVLRAWKHVGFGTTPERLARVPELEKKGYAALEVMESHLKGKRFFVGERFGLADIALYAYTHVAEEGGFDLSRYPAIRGWLAGVAAQPGHVPITFRPPVGNTGSAAAE
jgi:glutathione S-transferase